MCRDSMMRGDSKSFIETPEESPEREQDKKGNNDDVVEHEDFDTPKIALIDPEEEKNSRKEFEERKRVARFSDLND